MILSLVNEFVGGTEGWSGHLIVGRFPGRPLPWGYQWPSPNTCTITSWATKLRLVISVSSTVSCTATNLWDEGNPMSILFHGVQGLLITAVLLGL